jgi:hypothetical protein
MSGATLLYDPRKRPTTCPLCKKRHTSWTRNADPSGDDLFWECGKCDGPSRASKLAVLARNAEEPPADLSTDEEAPASGTRRPAARGKSVPRLAALPSPLDPRPIIKLTTELHEVIDKATAALAAAPHLNIYERDTALVQVIRSTDEDNGRRDAGAPLVRPIQLPTLRELLTASARFARLDGRSEKWASALPTDAVVAGTLGRGRWPGLRRLVGVLETPFLGPAGAVVQAPGFDAATGYLLETSEPFPIVPDAPTQNDARAALEELRSEVLGDFPFATPAGPYVAIAALLTILARPAIGAGNVPAFAFDANTPGTGKSLLSDVICLIATGRVAPKTGYPPDEAEMKKTLGSIALEACAIVSFDNIKAPFGGADIDRVLTCEGSERFRILGVTQMRQCTWRTVVLLTGNNIIVKGDTSRRALVCTQEATDERPELRQGFKHADLRGHVRQHRGRLVQQALTILRAFVVAGQPQPAGLRPLGSFEAWSRLIAGAIVWAGGADVLLAVADGTGDGDPEKGAVRALLAGWQRLDGAGAGLTVKHVLEELYPQGRPPFGSDLNDGLREAIEALCPPAPGKTPEAKRLSYKLRANAKRVFGKRRLESVPGHAGAVRWRVRSLGDHGDHGDHVPSPSPQTVADSFHVGDKDHRHHGHHPHPDGCPQCGQGWDMLSCSSCGHPTADFRPTAAGGDA